MIDRACALPILVLLLFLAGLVGCTESPDLEVTRINDGEAERLADQARQEISGTFAGDLDVSLWASDTLIADPIALDLDRQGRAHVTVTNRRYTSSLDLRDHPDWATEVLSFTRVEDRAAFLREKLAPSRSDSNSSWLTDYNDDGSHDWCDLTVEQEKVYRVEDTTGNDLADRSQLFYRGFNELTSDLAGAVCTIRGRFSSASLRTCGASATRTRTEWPTKPNRSAPATA